MPPLKNKIDKIGWSGCVRLVHDVVYSVERNLTIPPTVSVYVEPGATIHVHPDATLTIAGSFYAEPHRVFTGLGTAKRAVQRGDVKGGVKFEGENGIIFVSEWWGAKGDDMTDDSDAIQHMWNSIPMTGATVKFMEGKSYYIEKGTTINCDNLLIIGYGSKIHWKGELQGYLIPGYSSESDSAFVFWDGKGKTHHLVPDNLGRKCIPQEPTEGRVLQNIRIYGLTMDAGGGLDSDYIKCSQMIFFGGVDGFEIKDCTFQNGSSEVLHGAWYVNNGIISHNRFINCVQDGIAFITITNSIISDNLFQDVYQGLESGPYKVIIQGNNFISTRDCASVSKGIWIGDSEIGVAIDVSITGNTFGYRYGGNYAAKVPFGLAILVQNDNPANIKSVFIVGNMIDIAPAGGVAPIMIWAHKGVTVIKANTIADTGINQNEIGLIYYAPRLQANIDGGVIDISDNTLYATATDHRGGESAIIVSTVVLDNHKPIDQGKIYGVVANNKLVQKPNSHSLPAYSPPQNDKSTLYMDYPIVKLPQNIDEDPQIGTRIAVYGNRVIGTVLGTAQTIYDNTRFLNDPYEWEYIPVWDHGMVNIKQGKKVKGFRANGRFTVRNGAVGAIVTIKHSNPSSGAKIINSSGQDIELAPGQMVDYTPVDLCGLEVRQSSEVYP